MYTKLKTALIDLADENGLLESEVNITAKILTSEEAIGGTERKDFPLLQGKEFLIQADFKNALGQAFTDAPGNFKGKERGRNNFPNYASQLQAAFVRSQITKILK